MVGLVGREYSHEELQTIVRIRRRELTAKVMQLRRQQRTVTQQLTQVEGELNELEYAERLLE